MTFSLTCVTWRDHTKTDKNNKTLVELRTKCLSEPNTSQESKRQNIKSIPFVTHTAVAQVNIVTIKQMAQENILQALMGKQNIILRILLPLLSYIMPLKKLLALYKNTYQRMFGYFKRNLQYNSRVLW